MRQTVPLELVERTSSLPYLDRSGQVSVRPAHTVPDMAGTVLMRGLMRSDIARESLLRADAGLTRVGRLASEKVARHRRTAGNP